MALLKLLLIHLIFIAKHLLTPRLIAGNDAYYLEAPFMVSIQRSDKHICGGVIIAPHWILTAAHCVAEPQYLSVLAGVLSLEAQAADRWLVNKVIIHERYNQYSQKRSQNDIALLRLEKPFEESILIQPISLPSDASDLPRSGKFYGWGSVAASRNPVYPVILQVANLPIYSYKVCQRFWHPSDAVNEANFCTGPINGEVAPCTGDSGGPLVHKDKEKAVLVGIAVRAPYPCNRSGKPAIFIRVSAFIDWIMDRTNNLT